MSLCAICGAAARLRCERCRAWVCDEHVALRSRMRWERRVAYGGYPGFAPAPWRHYVCTGGVWRVCPGCRAQIAARDEREMAQDRRELLDRRITGAVALVAFLVAAGFGVAQDIKVLSAAPHHPTPTPPAILAPGYR